MIDNEGLNGTLKGCCNTLRLRFWTIGSVATASLVSGLCFDEEGGMMIRDGARRLGGTDGALDPRSHRKHRGETVKPRRGAGITPTSHRIAALHTTAVAARARFPLVVAPPPLKPKKKNGTACRGVMHFGRIVTPNGQDRGFQIHSSRSAVVFQVSPFTKLGTVQIAHEDSTNFS